MPNVAVIGAQWGDEGKGKVVDWLASRADVVVHRRAALDALEGVGAGSVIRADPHREVPGRQAYDSAPRALCLDHDCHIGAIGRLPAPLEGRRGPGFGA